MRGVIRFLEDLLDIVISILSNPTVQKLILLGVVGALLVWGLTSLFKSR